MKRPLLLSALIGCVFLGAGCALTGARPQQAEPAKKAEPVFPERRADVLVEGDYRSTTPSTVEVRRSFGERHVSLYVNGEMVRAFEVEPVRTSNRDWVSPTGSGPMATIDVQNLPTQNDTLYIIPHFEHSVEIVDREFDLTLIVAN